MMDTEQISKIAFGIGHPIRAKISELLKGRKKMTVTELQEALKKFGDIYRKDYSAIRKHLVTMQEAGIVDLRKDFKEGYIVELKLDVSITVNPIKTELAELVGAARDREKLEQKTAELVTPEEKGPRKEAEAKAQDVEEIIKGLKFTKKPIREISEAIIRDE